MRDAYGQSCVKQTHRSATTCARRSSFVLKSTSPWQATFKSALHGPLVAAALDRMTPPRMLTLTADIAALNQLLDNGMIEALMPIIGDKRLLAPHAMHVRVITQTGGMAAARAKVRRSANDHELAALSAMPRAA